MNRNHEWQDFKDRLIVFSIWAVSALIDAAFLALWVFVQWLVSVKVIKKLELAGLDRLVLTAFQLLFAISTLAPVVVHTYADIRVMILRARRRIQNEVEVSSK